MRFYVYVLKSLKDNRFYIGQTNDLARRLIEHNAGKTRSLKYRLPLELIYSEIYDSKTEAVRRECYLKALKGGNELKKIIGNSPP